MRSETVVRALRPISVNDEVTINYCASEEHILNTFSCDCGAPDCYGPVRGFAYLEPHQQAQIRGQLSPYLRSLRQR